MFNYIDRIPLGPLAIAAIAMAFAPFVREPHLFEKARMLFSGELSRPIDIFDLFWHSFLLVILAIRLWRYKKTGNAQ